MEDNEESEEEESEGDDIGNSDDEQEKEECLDNDEELNADLKLLESVYTIEVLDDLAIASRMIDESFELPKVVMSFPFLLVVASGSLFILSDEVRFLLIPSSLCQRLNKIGIPIQAGLVAVGWNSSTKKTPAHARLRIRPTVGLNLRATPSTVLSGTKGAGFFLQPLRL
ncbi:hypothetical protein PRIPAC_97431 [Pristionchus pacificus]|uniref:Uncharacterized protein n=1 Tax=Pristionchus pacificus TaxID=54126 RepID=A0A2A6D1V1_PRIPA|nr:hypothetical protein PRIPAC_97431 [Pristionchus pacificus]|eukprot:PDM84350.1 hypothetical protein PRIPAC_33373 [Pristionchus pacificus]